VTFDLLLASAASGAAYTLTPGAAFLALLGLALVRDGVRERFSWPGIL
jgi:hypothetical protein